MPPGPIRPLTVLVLSAAILCLGATAASCAVQARPNIVFVLTDDLDLNLVQFMPHVLAMERNGVSFANYFVTDSLCCPSRSSIFTGEFPHNSGVFRNLEPDCGYGGFNAHGDEPHTFAVAIQRGGYRTAMLGKYLNGYHPAQNPLHAGGTNGTSQATAIPSLITR